MNSLERLLSNAIGVYFNLVPRPTPSLQMLRTTKIVAHRGVHESKIAIENTLAAFQLAKDNQIWGVELDVRFTRDKIPVIHHDPHCGRCFNSPEIQISQTLFADLRKHVPDIPTLAEAIELLGKNTHLMIEIKEDLRHSPEHTKILEVHLQSLKPMKDYHLICLSPEYLEAFPFCPKEAMMDVCWLNVEETLNKNSKMGHGAVAGYFLFFSDRQIRNLHSSGRKVGLGFLDSKNSLFREINRGADFIFTNHPLRLKKYIDSEIKTDPHHQIPS